MGAFIGLLLVLPFVALIDVLALRRRWHAVPLPQRNMTRATAGTFVLAVCVVLAVHGFPVVGPELTAGVAAFALLYLVVGLVGVRSPRTFDPMSAFWWAVLVMIAGVALAGAFLGFPL